mmetsp:Transcript_44778/g.128272  ORF Transcript_44778/g.128272 Transcript_44778/m.128272 type:complete len:350 (-) Transcript_44778:414-1463(-)
MLVRGPSSFAGLASVMLLVQCLFLSVAVGLHIADDHGYARERSLERSRLEGRVGIQQQADSVEDLSDTYEGGHLDGAPDSDVYDSATGDPQRRVGIPGIGFPRGGRVAVVLRGASFRGKGGKTRKKVGCVNDTESLERQGRATDSLVRNVIARFEHYGNEVDVVVTDRVCNLTDERIVSRIGRERVKMQSQNASGHQRTNIMWAIDQLRNYSAEHGLLGSEYRTSNRSYVAVKYNLVLILRHDTVWQVPIDQWPDADFRKVLFPYQCPKKGVHDLFAIMPGSYLQFYYDILKWKWCFGQDDGHDCMKGMVERTNQSTVGVALRAPWAGGNKTLNVFSMWWTYGKKRQFC